MIVIPQYREPPTRGGQADPLPFHATLTPRLSSAERKDGWTKSLFCSTP